MRRRRRGAAVILATLLFLLPACSDAPPRDATQSPDGELLRALSRPAAGRLVLVRVRSGPDGQRFEPAELNLPDGGTVRFVFVGVTPESIVFDAEGLPPPARDFVRTRGLVRGPLLVRVGQTYDASFRDAPAGRYPFRFLLHPARETSGAVVVGRE